MCMKDTLMQLVEQVGHKGGENVAMGKVLPKGCNHCPDAIHLQLIQYLPPLCRSLRSRKSPKSCKGGLMVPTPTSRELPTLIPPDGTFGTTVLRATGYYTLLWMIGTVGCKEGEDKALLPICAEHRNTVLPSGDKGSEKSCHTSVESLIAFELTGLGGAAGESGDREVAQKDGGSLIWLAPNGFCDVAEREVDGVGCFVASKRGELSFVGCKDDWRNSSANWKLIL